MEAVTAVRNGACSRAGTVKAFLSAIQAAAPAAPVGQAAPAAVPASGDDMDTDAPAATAADGGSKET
jgi:hypothetical protein